MKKKLYEGGIFAPLLHGFETFVFRAKNEMDAKRMILEKFLLTNDGRRMTYRELAEAIFQKTRLFIPELYFWQGKEKFETIIRRVQFPWVLKELEDTEENRKRMVPWSFWTNDP